MVGEAVCAYLAYSDDLDCGTVQDDFLTWGPSGTSCNCVLGGGDVTGIYIRHGDSGSPIFTQYVLNGQARAKAIGIVDDTLGHFAIVYTAPIQWGDKLYGT